MSGNATLVRTEDAPLPVSYEHVREALAKCERIDECKSWGDQAMALASYARQAKDPEPFKMLQRIRLRAERRMGELLAKIEPSKGGAPYQKRNLTMGGNPTSKTRKAAAEAAGLSPYQAQDALRVASVPAAEFEALVESPNPPTLTELAERGTKKRSAEKVSRADLWAAKLAERDAKVAKLYKRMKLEDVARELGITQAQVISSARRVGVLKGRGSQPKNPLAAMERGLINMAGQFLVWTEDDAHVERSGANLDQYTSALTVLEQLSDGVKLLRKQMKKEIANG